MGVLIRAWRLCLRGRLRFVPLLGLALATFMIAQRARAQARRRPVIGVALGGGSALGLAHVGVIRWFEEHHVPIDVVAGTSMGGLVGGAYASGMSSAELKKLIAATDWEEMFGSSSYRYRSVRRKEDMRSYPSRLELGLRRGVRLPSALNNGQQVDVFLARIAAIYDGLATFDSLPTPFRCVAFDVNSAEPVVLDKGSLVQAMRATMSIPGVFPPVRRGEQLLVDGGAVNNVPGDVVRAMGADVVIAVNVGRLPDTREVESSLFSVTNGTVSAMTRANTRRGLAAADVIVNPALEHFGRLDWQLADAMAEEGYRAAEENREQLAGLAVSDEEWQRYLTQRAARRRTAMPVVTVLEVTGATQDDERAIRNGLGALVGKRLDVKVLDAKLTRFAAFDRYESVTWDLRDRADDVVLAVHARPRPNAPPFAMFALNAQNLTSDDYTFQLAARYLAFDVPFRRAELRFDVAVGSNPRVVAALRRPFGQTPFFGAAAVGARRVRRDFASDNAIVAQYDLSDIFAQGDVGAAFGALSELRFGSQVAHVNARRRVGDPSLPSLSGMETQAHASWLYDSQTRYIAPETGLRLLGMLQYVFDGPDATGTDGTISSNDRLTQLELTGSRFWSIRTSDRIFVTSAAGTSFGGHPLPTDQFVLGLPFRLDALSPGEERGDNYWALTGGYLHAIGQLPDFLGGSAYLGGWLENGAAFARSDHGPVLTQFGVGVIVETLVGPAIFGGSFGGGNRRIHLGFGGIFP